jgi:hypothetical protein
MDPMVVILHDLSPDSLHLALVPIVLDSVLGNNLKLPVSWAQLGLHINAWRREVH